MHINGLSLTLLAVAAVLMFVSHLMAQYAGQNSEVDTPMQRAYVPYGLVLLAELAIVGCTMASNVWSDEDFIWGVGAILLGMLQFLVPYRSYCLALDERTNSLPGQCVEAADHS